MPDRAQAKLDAHGSLPENAWGSQIRSYVLQPYQLIKDTRTGHETNNALGVLDGNISGQVVDQLVPVSRALLTVNL